MLCGLFHLARGSGRFGLIAIVLTIAVEAGQQLLGLPAAPVMNFWKVAIVGLVGLFACTLVLWIAVIMAAVTTIREPLPLWIDPTNRLSRIHGLWPPQPSGRNQVQIWTIVGAVFGSHLFGCFIIPLRLAGAWLLMLTFPAMALIGWLIASRITARTPDECWHPDDPADFPGCETTAGCAVAAPADAKYSPAPPEPD